MDFALTDEQTAIVDLARQILTDRCTLERLKEVESGTERFDRGTWNEFAKADLLGIVLAEDVGGGGFGFLEAALLLVEVGRTVAPLPLWSTLVGALTIDAFGTDAQRQAWLPGVVAGSTVLALGLTEIGSDARDPQLRAVREGSEWVLHGTKTTVSAMHVADAVLVPARDQEGGVRLFLVAADSEGLTMAEQDTFNHEPQFRVDLDGVRVGADALIGSATDRSALDWVVDRATVGLCALAAGVAEVGMRITAGYVIERKQFDKPLGTFQAVCHRMADCYIDAAAINLSMLQAATQLSEEAAGTRIDPKLIAVAKYWASESGSRVGHAGLHLHGGISIDLDYSIHRYFLWSKHLELQLGASAPQLATLGALLAAEPVAAG